MFKVPNLEGKFVRYCDFRAYYIYLDLEGQVTFLIMSKFARYHGVSALHYDSEF